MDEDKLLLAQLEDRYRQFLRRDCPVSSEFLNLHQQELAAGLVRQCRAEGHEAFLYGGYEGAERRLLLFVPDYLGIETEAELFRYYRETPAQCPLTVLDLTIPRGGSAGGGRALTHRDYLGSLMAVGIRREKLGDILVREDGARVPVMREIADYLQAHCEQVGRVHLTTRILPIGELGEAASQQETARLLVASPRLDNVIAAAFGLSRKEAAAAVTGGLVYVDDALQTKADRQLRGGEKLTVRGRGRVLYGGESGTSRKGRTYILIQR